MQRNYLVWTVAGLGVGLAVWFQLQPVATVHSEPEPREATVRVRAATVAPAPKSEQRWFYSTVRASNQAVVSFTSGGRLSQRPVNVGDRVEAGDVLAVIDQAPLRNIRSASAANVSGLQTQTAQLRRDLERMQALVSSGAVSQQQTEQVESQLKTTRSALRGARARTRETQRQYEETALKAPFAATVSKIVLEPGEFAAPGAPVLYLQGSNAVEIELSVPERLIGTLSKDDPVQVSFPLTNSPEQTGKIAHTAGAAGGLGGLFTVVVKVAAHHKETQVRPGMTASVALTYPVHETIAVPMAALTDPSGTKPQVFRIRENTVEAIPVTIGTPVGDLVTVRAENLHIGDSIVVAGHIGLSSGTLVKVIP